MKLEPSVSLRPPRERNKNVIMKMVKKSLPNETNLFEIIKNHTKNSMEK